MSIYTGNGDLGYSSIISGSPIPKSSHEFEVLGKLDELQAHFYLCLLHNSSKDLLLEVIAKDIYKINGFIAGASKKALETILRGRIKTMEQKMDEIEDSITPLSGFGSPNDTELSINLNLTRVKTREVERLLVSYFNEALSPERKIILAYFNRLSDYLFMLMLVS